MFAEAGIGGVNELPKRPGTPLITSYLVAVRREIRL